MVSRMICSGSSMKPTLQPGDLIEIASAAPVRSGDVVVFRPPGSEDRVVHRAIRVDCLGIRTRGDNSLEADPWVLRKQDILGQVARVHGSAGTPRRVLGGRSGLVYGAALRNVHGAKRKLTLWLRPFYHLLSRWGFPGRFLHPVLKPWILSTAAGKGSELQLFIGKRMIGRLRPGGSWEIRPPYRLYVDVNRLPRVSMSSCHLRATEKR